MNHEPRYVDIHSHLNFAAFDSDRADVLARTLGAGVWMMNVGTQKDTALKAVELAESVPEGVYAAVALHPIHTGKSHHDEDELGGAGAFTSRGETFDYEYYKKLALRPKVRAIGECGLDYFRLETDTKETQVEVFRAHIALANEVKKPLMLHVRNAYADAYDLIKAEAKVHAHLHFFAGTWEEAKKFLDIGCTLSYTGVITFAESYHDVIRRMPLDRLMAETDCPYVSPVPFRGQRNEPGHVREVVEKIAALRGEDAEKVRAQLVENSLAFLGESRG